MKQLTYLVLALLVLLNTSCEKDDPIDFKAILTKGTWRVTSYTASPGVRLGSSASSPMVTDVFMIYGNDLTGEAIYEFFTDGTVKISLPDSFIEDFIGNWSLSSDQKTLILSDGGYEVLSIGEGEFVLSETDLFYDYYLKEDVVQKTKMTFKQF